jgi:hypothetical protein
MALESVLDEFILNSEGSSSMSILDLHPWQR